jgi:mRNA-degrading endonuclease toxin of MazEF toxin-antitoxin module
VKFGDVLLARLPFPDGGGFKLRPVLVVHEHPDGDLLVVPVTTHAPRGLGDIVIARWQDAGLRLESTARMSKFATIAPGIVMKRLGSLSATDTEQVHAGLRLFLTRIS